MNGNQISANCVGEMVHYRKNKETGQFSSEKTDMAIPHQAFTCMTKRHMHTHTTRFLGVSVSLSVEQSMLSQSEVVR